MKLSFDIEVRTYELDSYGHVNNAVYLNYFEYTRLKYLDAVDIDYKGLVESGLMIFVTKVSIRYRKPIMLGDKITIEVEPTKNGVASGVFHQVAINQNGEVCAEADTTWGCISKETGRPTKFPEIHKLQK